MNPKEVVNKWKMKKSLYVMTQQQSKIPFFCLGFVNLNRQYFFLEFIKNGWYIFSNFNSIGFLRQWVM